VAVTSKQHIVPHTASQLILVAQSVAVAPFDVSVLNSIHAVHPAPSTAVYVNPFTVTVSAVLPPVKHRMAQPLSSSDCDKFEIWGGTSGSYTCVVDQVGGRFEEIPDRGELYVRGFLFSVMRKNRIRITYRYGGEPGDCPSSIPIPDDIEEATVKLAAIEILSTSFRMDQLPLGAESQLDIDKIVNRWQGDVDRIIRNREEIYVVTT